MGGRHKRLLEWNGQALICHQVSSLWQAGVDVLVVVLGHHAQRIAPILQGLSVRVLDNPHPAANQALSLIAGLTALSPHTDAVLVALADQPMIET